MRMTLRTEECRRRAAVCAVRRSVRSPMPRPLWTQKRGRCRAIAEVAKKKRRLWPTRHTLCERRDGGVIHETEGLFNVNAGQAILAQSLVGVVVSRLDAHRSGYRGGRQCGVDRPASTRAREAAVGYRVDGASFQPRTVRVWQAKRSVMHEKIISRRKILLLVGLATSLAVPATVLMASDAKAQQPEQTAPNVQTGPAPETTPSAPKMKKAKQKAKKTKPTVTAPQTTPPKAQ